MDAFGETAWCPPVQRAPSDTTAIDSLFQMGPLDCDFSFSDFDQTHQLYARTSQFLASPDLFQTFASPPPTRAKSRVILACTLCRSRHAKCDATVPACSQCRVNSRTCSYPESRRGRAKVGRVEHGQRSMRERQQSETERPHQMNAQQSRPASSDTSLANSNDSNSDQGCSPVDLPVATQTDDYASSSRSEPDEASKLLNLYYTAFHNAHPVVLHRQFLNRRLQTDRSSLRHLLPAMEYVGSFFAPGVAKEALQARAESVLARDLFLRLVSQSSHSSSTPSPYMLSMSLSLRAKSWTTLSG